MVLRHQAADSDGARSCSALLQDTCVSQRRLCSSAIMRVKLLFSENRALAPIPGEHVSGEKRLQRRLRGMSEGDDANAGAGYAALQSDSAALMPANRLCRKACGC